MYFFVDSDMFSYWGLIYYGDRAFGVTRSYNKAKELT